MSDKTPLQLSSHEPVILENNVDELENIEGTTIDNWNIHEIIGKGAFGCVYRCSTKTKDGTIQEAAIKCEKKQPSNDASFLKIECSILLKLIKNKNMENFTLLYNTGKRKNFNYMVMTLLGPNLFDICAFLPGEKMEIGTWVRVVYQALSAIQSLHEIKYIHLDIKPANFALGHKNDPIRCQVIHLLDFGLSRKYGSRTKPMVPTYNAPKQGIEYVGTVTHCSPYAHSRIELSRRDDMWSWLFMCIDLYNELPWRELQDEQEIENFKKSATYQLYCDFLPKHCDIIINHIMKLGTYDYPDYELCFTQLLLIIKDENIKITDPYQWENLPIETKEILRLSNDSQSKLPSIYENMKQRLDILNNESKVGHPIESLIAIGKNNKTICQQQEKTNLKELDLEVTQEDDSTKEVKDKKNTKKNASIELKINKKRRLLNDNIKGCLKNRHGKKKENVNDENQKDGSNKKILITEEIKTNKQQKSIEKIVVLKQQQNKITIKYKNGHNNESFTKNPTLLPHKKYVKRRRHIKKLPAVNYDPNMVAKIKKRFKDNTLQKLNDKIRVNEIFEERTQRETSSSNSIERKINDYK
uniref:Protein kinase domain-containing protein n=1 Tax=Strongyloides stercoralis TaxID=6248 RepID=A0AAF5DF64_STRER